VKSGDECSIELEQRMKTLQTVSEVGTIISSRLTLRELTRAVVDHLGKVLKNDRVNLVLYRPETRMLEFIASFISGEVQTSEPEVYPLSDGMNSWIIKNRRPLLLRKDTIKECRALGIRHGGRPAQSWLGAPLVHNGKIIGVLSVQSYSEPDLYDDISAEMLALVAGQVAVAVENARLYEATARREIEKQRLYFSLTHDLIGFVSPIVGFAELLRRLEPDEFGEKKDEISSAIAASADRINRFIEDILLYSKLESGKLQLSPEPVNIYRVIGQSLANFRPQIELRGLAVSIDGKETARPADTFLEKTVNCDVKQIERVLNNCIQNAVKHAATAVTVSTGMADGMFSCEIRDDGAGMPKELSDKIFDEYFQAEGGRKGVGLGLPSVKRIVEQHGGNVKVETDTGKGFAFTFTLPPEREVEG
jgi:signal transduction histidine kinase